MGRDKNIESPEVLWEHFLRYKTWTKSNPRLKEDYVGKDADRVMRHLERPLTFVGFEVYLRNQAVICDLGDYKSNKDNRYTEYATIIRACESEISQDLIDGALVGQYAQNIVARLQGLVDKQERKVTKVGKDLEDEKYD